MTFDSRGERNARLEGKVAIVTGAARGMGRATAIALAKEGVDIVICDICRNLDYPHYPLATNEQMYDTKAHIRKLGRRIIALKADVRRWKQVEKVVNAAIDTFGRIDILVNNAGIAGITPIHELAEKEWDILMEVNLKGPFLFCRLVIPHMIKQNNGRIINISSIGGLRGLEGFAHYCASKFGIIGLTKSMAIELAKNNINVNAVCPGTADTDLDAGVDAGMAPGEGKKVYAGYHLFRRLVEPQEIANAVVWLATEDSKNVTGHTLVVDGGFLLA
jgi:NAD(P)-dependent dehydrogenase (short-subunit alcohol dehydrogenase family)